MRLSPFIAAAARRPSDDSAWSGSNRYGTCSLICLYVFWGRPKQSALFLLSFHEVSPACLWPFSSIDLCPARRSRPSSMLQRDLVSGRRSRPSLEAALRLGRTGCGWGRGRIAGIVGGESLRPGAIPVPEQQELDLALFALIEALSQFGVPLSSGFPQA